ncbi:Lipopolysaccharide export system protein LptA [Corallococcus coralloides]|uniref:Lipopolysaccharide export system protein LptA n=1 Tax=Corallococcus coralloides TaxID=184914 RepID=A0A410RL10_CORCK|nr:LptA/OstA family protein [Corallococcus coralloides]QAT82591.1 Lipopolysaccharide export system protein LptA [Corallococcus coralloides]
MIEFLVMALFLAQPASSQAAAPAVPGAPAVAQATPAAKPGAPAAKPGAPDAGTPAAPPPAPGTSLAPTGLRNPVDLAADHVTGDRNQAVLTGNVVVKHQTMDIRCDKMTGYYNATRQVTRVVCAGNVRAVDGDRQARGERADYDVPSGVLVVTGSPEARQGNTYLTGTKVRLVLGSERLEVENARILVDSPSTTAAPGTRKKAPAPKPPGTKP